MLKIFFVSSETQVKVFPSREFKVKDRINEFLPKN